MKFFSMSQIFEHDHQFLVYFGQNNVNVSTCVNCYFKNHLTNTNHCYYIGKPPSGLVSLKQTLSLPLACRTIDSPRTKILLMTKFYQKITSFLEDSVNSNIP